MWKKLLYALSSAVLLSLPWLGYTSLTLFVAFVPLLILQHQIAQETNKKGKARKLWPYATLTFALWWLATSFWVAHAIFIGIIAVIVIGGGLNLAAFMLYHAVWKRAPRALAYTIFVTAWIGYEYLYTVGEISFPWLTLGNGFAIDTKLIQWYEYTGVFGGSLWVLICNLLVFESWKNIRDWKKRLWPVLAFMVPVVFSIYLYYSYREPSKSVPVSVLQPNIDPYDVKFDISQDLQNDIIIETMLQCPPNTQFMVAPETAIGDLPQEGHFNDNPSVQRLRGFLEDHSPATTLVCGASTYRIYPTEYAASKTARYSNRGYWYDYYNSALSIDTTQQVDVHHKSILVVGAEKMPYYGLLKHLEFLIVDLGGISGQLGMDSVQRVFADHNGVRYGTAICYESIYGNYFANFVRNGAEIMFVITNDGWWKNTPGYRQHFSYSRLRAIETRRSIARSANTGISGFIDQRGNVGQTLGWDKRGALTDSLAKQQKITFYVRYGDVIARISVLIFALSILYFGAYRIRKKTHFEP